jgi:hypothetical protein
MSITVKLVFINIMKIPIYPVSATTSCPNYIKDAHSRKKGKKYRKRKVPLQRSKT